MSNQSLLLGPFVIEVSLNLNSLIQLSLVFLVWGGIYLFIKFHDGFGFFASGKLLTALL